MMWLRYFAGLIIIALLSGIFVLNAYISPCNSGLFIGACSLDKLFLIINLAVFLVNYSLISLLSIKLFKPQKIIKNIIIIIISVVISVVIIFPEDLIIIKIYDLSLENSVNKIESNLINNFSVTNFSEEPETDSLTGKYKAIDVSFDLTVKADDTYFGIVEIKPYFGNYMINRFDNVFIRADETKHFNFNLQPTQDFYFKKPDGPYFVSITLAPEDLSKWTNGKSIRGFLLKYSGDKNISVTEMDLYRNDLVTRAYLASDFTDPTLQNKFDPLTELNMYTHPSCGTNPGNYPFSISFPKDFAETDISSQDGSSHFSYNSNDFTFVVSCKSDVSAYGGCAGMEKIQKQFVIAGELLYGCLVRDRSNNKFIFNFGFSYDNQAGEHAPHFHAETDDTPENLQLLNQILSTYKISNQPDLDPRP